MRLLAFGLFIVVPVAGLLLAGSFGGPPSINEMEPGTAPATRIGDASLICNPSVCDFGTTDAGTEVRRSIVLLNEGPGVLRVDRVEAPCICTTAASRAITLRPHESVKLEVLFRALPPFGRQHTALRLHITAPLPCIYIIPITANVEPVGLLRPTLTPDSLDVGLVAATDQVSVGQRTLARNLGASAVTIRRVRATPGVHVTAIPSSATLEPGATREITISLSGTGRALVGARVRLDCVSGGSSGCAEMPVRGYAIDSDSPARSGSPQLIAVTEEQDAPRSVVLAGTISDPERLAVPIVLRNATTQSGPVRVVIHDLRRRVRCDSVPDGVLAPGEQIPLSLTFSPSVDDGTLRVPGTVVIGSHRRRFEVVGFVRRPTVDDAVGKGARTLRVVAVSEQLGELAPCECATGQAGGLSRLVTFAGSLRASPTLLCQLGDLCGQGGELAGRKLATGLAILGTTDRAVVVPGSQELALGLDRLVSAAKTSGVPIIACNVYRNGLREPALPPHALLEIDGLKVCVIGAVDPSVMTDPSLRASGLLVTAGTEEIQRSLAAVRESVDCAILALYGRDAPPELVADSCPGLTAVVVGRGQASHGGRTLRSGVAYLATRPGGKVAVHLRLAISQGFAIAADFGEATLDREIARDAGADDLLRRYKIDLRTLPQPPIDVSVPQFAGAHACRGCHQDAWAVWERSGHAHAFASLAQHGDEADPDCLQCHTLGFNVSNGYRVGGASSHLANVQCESCHGAAAQHATDPRVRTTNARPGETCRRCHDPVTSPGFDDARHWTTIAHGD